MSSALKTNGWTLDDFVNLFKTFSILEGFPEHLALQLAQAAEIVDVPANTQILRQGQHNEYLYFLVDGQIGVYVDGARVSKLQRRGDILGEMSVVSNHPVGATILAETQVSLIRVDSRVFLDMRGPERDLYLSILYRIYATVLSEKLHQTNQKAKHFEELSYQLEATKSQLESINLNLEKKVEERTLALEQQNAALLAGKNQVEELLNSKALLFQKLSEFNEHHLVLLKNFLDEWRKSHPNDSTIDEARSLVHNIQQIILPLTEQYSTEQAMHSKRVLLADSDRKQQAVGKMALGGSGVDLDQASEPDEAKQKIESGSYDLVFLDMQMLDLANTIKAKNPKTEVVLMTSEMIPAYLPLLKKLNAIPCIVSRDETDRTFTVKNIITTVTKLLSQDLFGLEKYLSWGVDVQSRTISSSHQRGELIQEVDSYFEKLGIRRANRERVRVVLEEMLMNAIYDAPVSKDGKALYNHMARTQEFKLKPDQQGTLRFATDGMLLAVSVQDPFGSLKGETILHYLEHNYNGSAASLNESQNKAGAGRGLHQIVENSDLVVFNLNPGKRTEVIGLFNADIKQAGHKNPSFHFFVKSSK